jgi:NADH:ubiquinone oxidoreductase subunit 5 (subunit L)/multisubunit Na+/H+ antiporter MnhA subunit
MFETAGTLALTVPVATLAGLLMIPLLWALACFAAAVRHAESATRAIALTAASLTLAWSIFAAAPLAVLPRGALLVQHVAQVGRLGQLDLAFDLTLDPRSATLAVVIACVGCASTWMATAGRRSAMAFASTGLVTGGALLVVVGDGLAPLLLGLGLVSVASFALAHGDARASAVGLGGNAAVLVGMLFLFWSLGGAFGPSGYDPDGSPRFVLVASRSGHSEDRATLAMTTHAGALVSSDDSDLPGEPVASPFSIDVEPGIRTLRVQSGVASADVVVPHVALVSGYTHVLTPYGPTASLRGLDDQIAVPRLAPNGAPATVRATLQGRTVAGLRSSAVVLLLVLGGALAHVFAMANRRGEIPIVIVLEAIAAPYLALRLAPLVDSATPDGWLVVFLGAGSAFLLAGRAACLDDAPRALRGVLASATALAVATIGLGEGAAALVLAAGGVVAVAAALAAIEARRDVRWLGVACAAAVGLLPGAGVSTGYILAANGALSAAMNGNSGTRGFGWLVAATIVISAGLAAVAAFRVYDTVIRESARRPGSSRAQGAVAVVLTVVALAGGAALGAGTTLLGGSVSPLARRFVGSGAQALPRAWALIAAALPIVAAAAGVVVAKSVTEAPALPRWLRAVGRPYTVLGWSAGILRDAMTFLQRSVRAMDRELVEDVPLALRELIFALRKPAEPAPPDPLRDERFRTSTLLVLVALLGLIVLSSVLLR